MWTETFRALREIRVLLFSRSGGEWRSHGFARNTARRSSCADASGRYTGPSCWWADHMYASAMPSRFGRGPLAKAVSMEPRAQRGDRLEKREVARVELPTRVDFGGDAHIH